MELVSYLFAVVVCGTLLYLLSCLIFFLATGRPAGLALGLSWKLCLASLVGMVLIGFGSVVFAALVLHGALLKTENYSKVRDIVVSLIIATANSAALFFLLFSLAWGIMG